MTHAKRAIMISIAAIAAMAALGCGIVDSGTTDGEVGADGGGGGGGGGGTGGDGGTKADGSTATEGETGRMVGMTEAHNVLRRAVETDPPIPDLTWDTDIAAVAQAYSETLAAGACELVHSKGAYGENLYWQSGMEVTPDDVVGGWYGEVACYTYGTFSEGDKCDQACIEAQFSSGCGHYTQVVWRTSLRLGCGMATCSDGAEIWTCNYDPPGNWVGELAY